MAMLVYRSVVEILSGVKMTGKCVYTMGRHDVHMGRTCFMGNRHG